MPPFSEAFSSNCEYPSTFHLQWDDEPQLSLPINPSTTEKGPPNGQPFYIMIAIECLFEANAHTCSPGTAKAEESREVLEASGWRIVKCFLYVELVQYVVDVGTDGESKFVKVIASKSKPFLFKSIHAWTNTSVKLLIKKAWCWTICFFPSPVT